VAAATPTWQTGSSSAGLAVGPRVRFGPQMGGADRESPTLHRGRAARRHHPTARPADRVNWHTVRSLLLPGRLAGSSPDSVSSPPPSTSGTGHCEPREMQACSHRQYLPHTEPLEARASGRGRIRHLLPPIDSATESICLAVPSPKRSGGWRQLSTAASILPRARTHRCSDEVKEISPSKLGHSRLMMRDARIL